MEIIIGVLGLLAAVAVIMYVTRDKGSITGAPFYDNPGAHLDNTPRKPKESPKAAVKVTEVKATTATSPKLPSKPKLLKMTKAQLELAGREHGIELDKRKSKEVMVDTLKAEFKAAQKAAK